MVDLGKYAFEVLASYAATLALLGGLIGLTWARSRRVRARLAAAEGRARNG